MFEEWKPVVSYEGMYEVSSEGRVRSKNRVVMVSGVETNLKSKIKSLRRSGRGYLDVQLHKEGVRNRKFVHRLVAESFLPNGNGDKEVNHINAIKHDNRVSNLEWCSRSHNMKHAAENGLMLGGKKKGPVVLTLESARSIRSDHSLGCSTRELSEKHNVSIGTIRDVLKRRTWKEQQQTPDVSGGGEG